MALFGGRAWFAAACAVALLCSILLLSQTPRPCDDAYITFRHVRHLVERDMPVWNLGSRPVLGSTTPGFMFTLALFCKLTHVHDVPLAALWLNAFFHFGIVLLAFLLARKTLTGAADANGGPCEINGTFWINGVALSAAVLVGFNSVHLYAASQGFENAMLVFLVLDAIYCLVTGRYAYAVLLTSLAPLVRPEGIVLSVITWVFLILSRRFRWQWLIFYLIVPVLWIAFAESYYGSPIPHSIIAKRHASAIFWPYSAEEYPLAANVLHVFPRTIASWRAWGAKILFNGATHEAWNAPGRRVFCWIATGLTPVVLALFIRRRSAALMILAYAVLVLLFFSVLGSTATWYYPSFVVSAVLSLYLGGAMLVGVIVGRDRGGARVRAWALLCVALFIGFAALNRYTYHRGLIPESRPWLYARDCMKGDASGTEIERYEAYKDAAAFMNKRIRERPGAALISEVGVFAYFFEGDVIDSGGLCSPQVLPFFPPDESDLVDSQGRGFTTSNHTVPARLVEALKPKYIVNSPVYLGSLARPGGVLEQHYDHVNDLKPAWGQPVAVYRRHDE